MISWIDLYKKEFIEKLNIFNLNNIKFEKIIERISLEKEDHINYFIAYSFIFNDNYYTIFLLDIIKKDINFFYYKDFNLNYPTDYKDIEFIKQTKKYEVYKFDIKFFNKDNNRRFLTEKEQKAINILIRKNKIRKILTS